MNIVTEITASNDNTNLLRCPKCNQVLMDAEFIRGHVDLKIMCRRCKSMIRVTITS